MEILHHHFADQLLKPGRTAAKRVYLLHGEPVLVGECVQLLIDLLLDGADRSIHCEVLDGAAENIPDLLERLNTYGWSGGPKVVWFKEARFFESAASAQRSIEQIREALENEQLERAARSFAGLCARLGVETAAAGRDRGAELESLRAAVGEDGVRRLAEVCRDQGWSGGASDDYLQALEQGLEKGFPPRHHLVITTSAKVPKNRTFYKRVDSVGAIVDCHVPLGERRADKMAQEEVLRQILDRALKKSGKRLAPGLFATLSQLTGFDPAVFRDNAEKLIDYTGARADITAADVEAVVRRSKSDPLFELTNAVADRHCANALFYLHTLLGSGWHPLQILAALANQIRKLLLAKDFTQSPEGKSWRPGMAYPQFQSEVWPAVQAFDERTREQVGRWTPGGNGAASKGRAAGKKEGGDPALAPHAGSAYPVYQTLSKSENYLRRELVQALAELSRVDMRLKSSGLDPALPMKSLILTVCRPPQRP